MGILRERQIFLFLRVCKMECQYFYPNSYHLCLGAEKKMHEKKGKERVFNDNVYSVPLFCYLTKEFLGGQNKV